ncbi:DEAD/DEAH box helicase [Pseudomonas syringae group genomosp. 3]|nr:DEAD/DEAH box helicase [Pseudomonas syringae group genomosp. 3]
MRPGKSDGGSRRNTILKSMCRIPTIGPVRAERLLSDFGEDFLASMLLDNVSEFINLMDAKGNFIFSDRQAKRMERAMANIEFGFGEGGYQRHHEPHEAGARAIGTEGGSAACIGGHRQARGLDPRSG